MADLKNVFEKIKEIDSGLTPSGYVSKVLSVLCSGLSYYGAVSVAFDEGGHAAAYHGGDAAAFSESFQDASVGIADAARDIKRTIILKSGGRITLPSAMKLCVSIPLSFGKDIIGALVLYGFEKDTVSDEEIEFLEQLSALIAFASVKNEYLKQTQARAGKLDDAGLNSIIENISKKVL